MLESNESALEANGFHNGVWLAKQDRHEELIDFPKVVGIPPSILKAPIFVLSDEVSRKIDKIVVKWGDQGYFTFSRKEVPFPTATHAFYFQILLSKFACKWNREGKVSFKFAEVLRLAGKNPRSPSDAIVEMIWRYMNADAKWENSFGPRFTAWTGHLIQKCDLWDVHRQLAKQGSLASADRELELEPEQANVDSNADATVKKERVKNERVKRNPGRSKDEGNWHTVWFHPEIVDALKAGETRLYYSKIYKMGLNPSESIIYNYFCSFGDVKGYWHSLYNDDQGLIKAFSWTSPKHKFWAWLRKYLDTLVSKKLIDQYKINDESNAVFVKVKSFESNSEDKVELVSEHDAPENLQRVDGKIVDVEHEFGKAVADALTKSGLKNRKKGNSSPVPQADLATMTDAMVLKEYLARRFGPNKDLIENNIAVEIIDSLLEIQDLTPAAAKKKIGSLGTKKSKERSVESALNYIRKYILDPKKNTKQA